jgi:transposase-like protein
MSHKKGPTAETKIQAVLALLRKEEPASLIARRYGIAEATLYRWKDEYHAAGQAALSKKASKEGDVEIRQLKKEVEERDRVIGELTIANRILKKIQDGLL